MNYEDKIKELTERIEILEKQEHKRIIKKRISIAFKLIKASVLIIIIIMIYSYVKPYKEKIDELDNKVNSVETYVKDKWNSIQKYNPFN